MLLSVVSDVVVAGGYAYVADVDSGLRIIDVASPAAPTEVGFYDTPGNADGVAIAGDYAYVADRWSGLRIINVSNPAAPTETGFYDVSGLYAFTVAVVGDYAHVVDYHQGVHIVNVTNPAAPTKAGFYSTPQDAYGVAAAGDYIYVTAAYDGLRIVNVANPTAPVEAGFYDTPGVARDVAVVGNYAYVASEYAGLRIINVADPAAPTEVGFYDTSWYAEDVAVAGNYAYIAAKDDGLRIINVSSPAAPTEAGFHDRSWYAEDVAVAGNYAYIAATDDGLRIINITNPTDPTETGFHNTPGRAYGMAVTGNHVYAADLDAGLRIISAANPTAPTEVGFYNTPGNEKNVVVAGNYAYVAAYRAGLRIISVSDPASPTEVGFYDTPGVAEDVVVAGDYAYVADLNGLRGLRIINVANPAIPAEVGFYETWSPTGVAMAGNYVYIADGAGLRIINVADPASPTEAGFYDTSWYAGGVEVMGNYAFVATGDEGLHIINITNPANPTEVGFYNTPGEAHNVTVAGNYVYVADDDGGLVILCYSDTPHPGDPYEPDDTCAQANPILTDGTVQQHTFHQPNDEDWAHFTVVSGTTYVLQATSTSLSADMVLELYDACGGSLEGSDDNAFGTDARIIFTAPSSGTYYVKALNHDPAAYGPDVTYELSVRAQSPAPIVVIVAGRNETDQLESNITFMGDQAYRTFRRAGVPRENIRYLSVGVDRDADQDGHLDVDDLPSRENVRYAVRDWPEERGLESGKPFYLYLTDHGGTDYYCAMGCGSGSWVRAEDLDLWLDDLEDNTGVEEINVIIEACYSGSFIDVTAYGAAEISSPGRVVIASTGSRARAFPSERGGYFSDAFFTALGDNADLWTAYVTGRTAAQAAWTEQTPWLDDNGDAVADGEDGPVARGRGLASFGGGAIPVVDWLEVSEINANGVATVTAKIRDDVAVLTATVEIYAPGLAVPDTEEGETPILPIDRLELRDDDDDGVYEGVYTGFAEEGLYRLVAYAWDNDGNLSLPRAATAGEMRVYLPSVLKQ
jgi:hypothetical protein